MATSQNGWEAISSSSSPLLHKWILPGANRHLLLRRGSGGFLLAHYAYWYHDEIERLDLGIWDEWAWAYRDVRGSSTLSNHASGTAIDLNATRHPLGVAAHATFTTLQLAKMRKVVHDKYKDTIRLGAFYNGRPDGMHAELDKSLAECERVARVLVRSKRGIAVLAANPGQKKVILS